MGTPSGNPTWQDFPSTDTPVTADALNNIEAAIVGKSDTAHTHDDRY